jgi:DNA-binding XRE family transcriptional regulator
MRDTACRAADLDLRQPHKPCQDVFNLRTFQRLEGQVSSLLELNGDETTLQDPYYRSVLNRGKWLDLLPTGAKRRENPTLPLIGYKMDIRSVDDIRQLVRAERKRRRLSQARASGLTGFSQKWLSEFELGRVNPPIDMVLKIMTTLGIKLKASVAETPDLDGGDDEEITL